MKCSFRHNLSRSRKLEKVLARKSFGCIFKKRPFTPKTFQLSQTIFFNVCALVVIGKYFKSWLSLGDRNDVITNFLFIFRIAVLLYNGTTKSLFKRKSLGSFKRTSNFNERVGFWLCMWTHNLIFLWGCSWSSNESQTRSKIDDLMFLHFLTKQTLV